MVLQPHTGDGARESRETPQRFGHLPARPERTAGEGEHREGDAGLLQARVQRADDNDVHRAVTVRRRGGYHDR